MDQVFLAKSPVVHQTITILGLLSNAKMVSFRIRIKIHTLTNQVEISSISTFPVDFTRIKDFWTNFSTFCFDLYQSLRRKMKKNKKIDATPNSNNNNTNTNSPANVQYEMSQDATTPQALVLASH